MANGLIILLLTIALVVYKFYLSDTTSLEQKIYDLKNTLVAAELANHLNSIIDSDNRVNKSSNLVLDDLMRFDNITLQQRKAFNSLMTPEKTITGVETIHQNSAEIIKSVLDSAQSDIQFHLKHTPKCMKYLRTQLSNLNNKIDDLNKEKQ